MKMNDTWKDFRVNERAILFKPGFAHGFDLAGFKPGGFKKMLRTLGIPMVAKVLTEVVVIQVVDFILETKI